MRHSGLERGISLLHAMHAAAADGNVFLGALQLNSIHSVIFDQKRTKMAAPFALPFSDFVIISLPLHPTVRPTCVFLLEEIALLLMRLSYALHWQPAVCFCVGGGEQGI